ncbi:MAG: hypothetical protein AAF639_05435 [Chloroflexota bacterium]
MAFNCTHYRKAFFDRQATNPTIILGNAAVDGVQLTQVTAQHELSPGQHYWRALGVHHLTSEENGGDHNVYADLVDEQGQPMRYPQHPNLRLKWGWEGETPEQHQHPGSGPKKFDKITPDEPMTDVPIFAHQHIWVEIEGHDWLSDRVSMMGLNGREHESYYVLFQKAVVPQPVPPPPSH